MMEHTLKQLIEDKYKAENDIKQILLDFTKKHEVNINNTIEVNQQKIESFNAKPFINIQDINIRIEL